MTSLWSKGSSVGCKRRGGAERVNCAVRQKQVQEPGLCSRVRGTTLKGPKGCDDTIGISYLTDQKLGVDITAIWT